jgi:hypothetical protein
MKLIMLLAVSLASVAGLACTPSEFAPKGPSSIAPSQEEPARPNEPVSTAQPEPSNEQPTLVIPLPACSRIDATEHPSLRHYCDAASAEVRSLATSAKDAVIEGAIKTGEAAQQERDKLPEQAAAARKFGGTVIDDAKDEINQLRK